MLNGKEFERLIHDLRNELSAIYSYAELLEMSLSRPANRKELEIVQALAESARKMNALIVDQVDNRRR